MSVDLPPISVVVIGRNEGKRLVRCLESVRAVNYPADRIELIYVDTDSTDNSCDVAKKLGAKVIRVQPERPSAAAARNAGLHAARHGLIQFLDGDTILNASWLREGVAALDDPSVACVFGRVEEVAPTASIYNFWAHHDWHVPPGPTEACGGIAMFRRNVLLITDGYDPSLIAGEERDLCFRLIRDQKITILRLDERMALHDIDITRFAQYWQRCFRSGYAYAEVSSRYSGLRRWRRTCRNNIAHAALAVAAIVLSLGFLSVWPVAVWAGLLALAVGRNAVRCRAQVGSIGRGGLYAVHHYLSKVPTVVGHLAYYRRHLWGGNPKRLIEYRGRLDGQGDELNTVVRLKGKNA